MPSFGSGASTNPEIAIDPIDRQLLIVLDPRLSPPRSVDLVRKDTSREGVAEFLADIDGFESIVKVLNASESTDLAELRIADPLSPEVLLNEYLIITLRVGVNAELFLQGIRRHRWVLSAERNFRLRYSARFLDPGTSSNLGTYQWGLTASSPLNFAGAWGKLTGTAYLAAVDNGVYWVTGQTHPDLKSGLRPHFSAHVPTPPVDPPYVPLTGDFAEGFSSPIGHGTHVMGLMFADDAGAGYGVSGACPGCSGFIYRIVQADLTNSLVGLALSDAVRSGAQVVNLSLGFAAHDSDNLRPPTFCTNYPNTFLCTALALANSRGATVVASSGNKKVALDFPANQATVIAVGGLEKDAITGVISFFANGYENPGAGPCPLPGPGNEETGSNCSDSADLSNSKYHFLAPAKDVLSTFYLGADYSTTVHCGDRWDPYSPTDPLHYFGTDQLQTGYGTCTGTSMAAPIVSGLVGLMRSANPLLNAADIQAVLKRRSSGAGTPISPQYGWGIPSAADAVIAALSGANAANPNLYDASIVNRTTPLFSLYSSQGRNHFYTVVPQMASASILGTLKPAPSYAVAPTQWTSLSCPTPPPPCNNASIGLPGVQVLNPDGTNAGVNAGVRNFVSGGFAPDANPNPGYSLSNSLGVAAPYAQWTQKIPDTARQPLTFSFAADTLYPLAYTPRGNLVSGYNLFPGVTTIGIYPRTLINVYVSHVNPTGGAAMVPLYRLSRKCGDFTSSVCTPGSPNYNAFHVSHFYSTSPTEVATLTTAPYNYKKDGIEGYVFPTSYANAPVTGAARLCRLLDPVRDEAILFPGTGTNGKACNPPFPSYATGSYYSSQFGSANWIGWIVPNYAGNSPPSVSLTSPANGATYSLGSSVQLTATASDSNGIGSVKFYANGVLVATDNTSPYNKSWTPAAAGSYRIYAMATDNNSASLQATSNPVDITVGSCPNTIPTIANAGFEIPSLGFGNYDDAPAGASWTFVPVWGGGQSGISANGSVFTDHNPNAPAGSQVGYIQGANTISQVINFPSCGTYRVRISAAQRDLFYNESTLGLDLYVDGAYHGSLTPADRNYVTLTSSQFYVSAGNHTITFQGVNNGYDNSVFIDSVQIISP